MKITFHLRGPSRIDWTSPENFNFQLMCLSIRASGHFVSDTIYIPATEIVAITCENVAITRKSERLS